MVVNYKGLKGGENFIKTQVLNVSLEDYSFQQFLLFFYNKDFFLQNRQIATRLPKCK